MLHKWTIEKYPLQTYASALVFSPARSLIRILFKKEEPKWNIEPAMDDHWDSRLLQTLEGHSDAIWSVAFSPDSSWIASASRDRTVKIWDTSNARLLRTLEGHSKSVTSVAFSRNSALLASGSMDHTVKIWDTRDYRLIRTLEDHGEDVISVIFSPDSERLASASRGRTVMVWDTSNTCLLKRFDVEWAVSIESIVFRHDSVQLATLDNSRLLSPDVRTSSISIWDTTSGELLQRLIEQEHSIKSFAFSADSVKCFYSLGAMIKIWDLSRNTSAQQQTLDCQDGVSGTAFSRDLTRLASTSVNGTIRIWDINSSGRMPTYSEGQWLIDRLLP